MNILAARFGLPTDAELAALFAISVERVRHHRRLLWTQADGRVQS